MTKAISKMNKQIESIDDMHRFIESFPEFRHQSGSVAKHVNLISEERSQQTCKHQTSVAHFVNFWTSRPVDPSSQLSKIINEKSLMTVSRAEQEVVCGWESPQRNPVYILYAPSRFSRLQFCYVRSDRVLAFDLVMDLLADNKVESGDYFIKQQLKNKLALSPDFTIWMLEARTFIYSSLWRTRE